MCMIRSVLHTMVFQEPHKLCRSHDDFKVGSLDSGSRGLARLELLQDHYMLFSQARHVTLSVFVSAWCINLNTA